MIARCGNIGLDKYRDGVVRKRRHGIFCTAKKINILSKPIYSIFSTNRRLCCHIVYTVQYALDTLRNKAQICSAKKFIIFSYLYDTTKRHTLYQLRFNPIVST
uniref:Uncharacterized protein n=1 Tax=Malacosoma sp. alphabaculovirus TaxID=1881632 RepID=A0A1B1V5R6_9ABAC|nr:hypothetical protein [Malacosoma sp. alphabaculovirus]